MKIKSAKDFRYWYKTKHLGIDENDRTYNENFLGTYHKENGDIKIKGFFNMYHGDKPDIASFLPSILKIAEDGQAIYEFLQNAVDCGSTHFYIFYNDNYFLAINNGSPFDTEGLQSILNIAQTTKRDPDKIGRFGIGFKLAHRLVGKNEGTDELVQQYKGPVLFSWSKLEDLESLLNNEKIVPQVSNTENYQEFINSPYLLKLLLTNFPSDPNEIVKTINFKDEILFPQEELNELVSFLNENFNQHTESLKKNVLKQGSLFFIKLGEDKKKLLDKDYANLVNGIQYSMNTLKKLQKVYINNTYVEKIPLQLEIGVIKTGSDEYEKISPEYKEFDIKFAIGFNAIKFGDEKSYEQIKLLKEKPNFYKYFPMGDEINGFGFIVHCDSFSNEANRRKLQNDDVNENLFPELAKHITQRLAEYKLNDRNKFLNLYASLLLSDIPERQNNKWLRPVFYDRILNSVQKSIPTKNGFSDNAQNVKINRLKLKLNLSDFGLDYIQWFEWDNEADKFLIDEATKSEKLGIQDWDIRDIVENSNIESINNWIETADKETYNEFLEELEESYLRIETKKRICQIKLFKFSNGHYYSFNEIISLKDAYGKTSFKFSNCFYSYKKVKGIKKELIELGLVVSDVSLEEYPIIFGAVTLPDDKRYYDLIAEISKTNTLKAHEKKNLFLNFINETTKFDNVGTGTLNNLCLFCDRNFKIKPLIKLVNCNLKTSNWLNRYKIRTDDYFDELNTFLIYDPEDIFNEIYLPNKDIILDELTTSDEINSLIKLFLDNRKSFFEEFIIKKNNNGFLIGTKIKDSYQFQSADKEARQFIDENCANNLFLLPEEFWVYKEEEGIIKADDLHSLILDFIDIDEHKEILVDFVNYKARYKFLQKLLEFRFNSITKYTKDDYEFKILDLACNELKDSDYRRFKNKVVIETGSQVLKLTEIPPYKENIKIEDYEISLAKILPDNYQNSDHLNNLIQQFIGIGLNKKLIENLFGVSEDPDPSYIFGIFSNKYKILENAEQLAFLLLYGMYIEKVDFSKFKALNVFEKEFPFCYDMYLTDFSFIERSEILHGKYRGVVEIFKEFPIHFENFSLIKEPYFENNKFVCPCIKDNCSIEQKQSLLDFLFNKWDIKDIKAVIKSINWSKIEEIDTVSILGFNPNKSVYPRKYACGCEALPDYLINWIEEDVNKIAFLSDLGVWTENSVIVELRMFLNGQIQKFQNSRLSQETRFNEDETVLFNSFDWLKENELNLNTEEQFDTFIKVVEVINSNRTKGQELIIQDEFDFELLDLETTKWESIGDFSIFLCKGALPKVVKLDEIKDFIFYRYKDRDFWVKEKIIYINGDLDHKETLQIVASEKSNSFSFEDLWQLFGEHTNETEKLKQEIETLKKQVTPKTDSPDSTFSEEVSEFITELEGTEWNNFVPELKNILELSVTQPLEKQKLFNLVAKVKLTKAKNVKFEDSDEDFNVVKIGVEKYFVHSARGAFAYIHPAEILKMKSNSYKMALDFGKKFKIYETAEEILELNTNHLLIYQKEKTIEELFSFCEANSEANRHLLIIDKNNSSEKSRGLFKLLYIEDDYQ